MKNNHQTQLQKRQTLFRIHGFTLIEIIVSLAIFSVVAVIAVGALVRVTGANRQAQAIQSGVNNVSFFLDAISREMRVGTVYKCYSGSDLSDTDGSNLVSNCSGVNSVLSGDTMISFNSSQVDPTDKTTPLIYAYLFHVVNGVVQIYKAEQSKTGNTLTGISGQSTSNNDIFYPVLSGSVTITNYRVGVFGNSSDPYGWFFVRLEGHVGTKQTDQSYFNVQTSVSERVSN